MNRDAPPPRKIIDNARMILVVLTAYQAYDEGLLSDTELRTAVGQALGDADVNLLVTGLAHTVLHYVKEHAAAGGRTVTDVLADMAAEIEKAEEPLEDH